MFLKDESGAVTVDWVVLTAGLVGLGLAAATVVSSGTRSTSTQVADTLSRDITWSTFNLLSANSDFSDVTGLSDTPTYYFASGPGSLPGWDFSGSNGVEIVKDGILGINSTDGGNMIDMGRGKGNLTISQTLSDANAGETYTITMSAIDPAKTPGGAHFTADNAVEVYFGGDYVGVMEAGSEFSDHSFEFVGGAGDGSNRLELREVGTVDHGGTFIESIVVK